MHKGQEGITWVRRRHSRNQDSFCDFDKLSCLQYAAEASDKQ